MDAAGRGRLGGLRIELQRLWPGLSDRRDSRTCRLAEKKVARMGLAIVNEQTCLPFADREACQLCVDECNAAGYEAIEFTQVHTQVDEQGQPVEGTGYLAPVVLSEQCVGCGLCQTRCYGINVLEKQLLEVRHRCRSG